MNAAPSHTPAMQQYHRMKAEHPDALLFFRMGDFYELFFEDAVVAAKALEIALTSRSKDDRSGAPIPMCGVPHHAGHRLRRPPGEAGVPGRPLRADGGPAHGQGGGEARGGARDHARARSSRPRPSTPARPASCWRWRPRPAALGAAWLDATTGEFVAAEWEGPDALGPAARRARRHPPARDPGAARAPRCPPGCTDPAQAEGAHPPRRARGRAPSTRAADAPRAARPLRRADPRGLRLRGPARGRRRGRRRAALRPRHAEARPHPRHRPAHARRPTTGWSSTRLTRRNLELVESLADGEPARHAARRARRDAHRRWARACCATGSCARWSSVEPASRTAWTRWRSWPSAPSSAARLREALGGVQDLDRIVGRVTLGTASPRDLVALARSLRALPAAAAGARRVPGPPACAASSRTSIRPLDVAEDVEATLVDEPPPSPARRRA